MRKIGVNKKWIGLVITLLSLVLFGWYFLSHTEDFSILLNISIYTIVGLALINAISIALNGIFMKWAVSLFGKRIKTNESVRISLISTAGNFFAPAGSGLGIRALYLKKRHSLSYADYISIVLCNYVIVFFIVSLLGLLALSALGDKGSGSGFYVLTILMIGLILFSLSTLFIQNVKIKTVPKNKILRFVVETIHRIQKGWSILWGDKRVILGLCLLILCSTGLLVLSTYLIASSLGIYMSVPSLVLYSVLGSLSVFVNITPGNLGIKEAVYMTTSTLIGLNAVEILSIAVVDRVVMFIVLFVLWLIYGRNIHKKNQVNSEI